jgi:hypothetical protein
LGRSEPSYAMAMPNFKALWEVDGPQFGLF